MWRACVSVCRVEGEEEMPAIIQPVHGMPQLVSHISSANYQLTPTWLVITGGIGWRGRLGSMVYDDGSIDLSSLHSSFITAGKAFCFIVDAFLRQLQLLHCCYLLLTCW